MASMRKLCWTLRNTVVPRRTFTTGLPLRHHPPGLPNDTLPFIVEGKFNKLTFTFAYLVFCVTGVMWPIMAARDQSIRIGQAVTEDD